MLIFKIKLSPEVGHCTVMPLIIFFRKHPREVDPRGEAFLPQRAYHPGRKQEGPEEWRAHKTRAGQNEAGRFLSESYKKWQKCVVVVAEHWTGTQSWLLVSVGCVINTYPWQDTRACLFIVYFNWVGILIFGDLVLRKGILSHENGCIGLLIVTFSQCWRGGSLR